MRRKELSRPNPWCLYSSRRPPAWYEYEDLRIAVIAVIRGYDTHSFQPSIHWPQSKKYIYYNNI